MVNNNWTIGIVTIPSRDKYLRKLLDSINRSQPGIGIKIIYNCEEKKAVFPSERIKNEFDGVKILYSEENDNSSDYPKLTENYFRRRVSAIPKARNQLLREAETPLVALFDDDCEIEGKNL